MDRKRRYLKSVTLFGAALLGMIAGYQVYAQELPFVLPPPSDLKVIKGIVYKKVEPGGQTVDLHFFEPLVKKYEKAPLVIYIHGGGFTTGDKDWIFKPDIIEVIRGLNKAGIACASIEYRLVKDGGPTLIDSAADCKDAIRFFARNAERFGVDASRIGVAGCSAGGVLALIAALGKDEDYPCDPALDGFSRKVKCAVTYYAAMPSLVDEAVWAERIKLIALKKPGQDPAVSRKTLDDRRRLWLGGELEEKRDIAKKLSPVSLVSAGSPPMLLIHGDQDSVSPVYGAYLMEKTACSKGMPVELLIVKGADHFLKGDSIEPSLAEVNRRTIEFFIRNLTQQKIE